MTATSTAPVHLVRGDDPTLLSDAVRELVASLVPTDDQALAVEDITLQPGDEQRIAAVLDACLTPPFLSDRRVVVVRNAGAITADEATRLVEYLAQPLETSTLVLVGGGGTVPQKLVAAVRTNGEVIDAGTPRSGRERSSWIAEKLKSSPLTFDAAATRRLAAHVGEDVARVGSLLELLVSAYGERARVGIEELEPFLGEAGAVAPWDLTDAIDKGDQALALEHLHRMMEAGDRHPTVVVATLHRHFQAMLRLDGSGARSDAEAAELLGLKGGTFPA
ncbi:MAG TPA: DNA polymerase III subunit delta, partial [Acidimicrobiales bacterium]|nr:DNA polymerase III subunit delta [Acidimicrobiales bacterium]